MNILPGLSSLFSPKPPSRPAPPPPLPSASDVANSEAEKRRKEEERLARKRRSGLSATRLTPGSGLGDEGSVADRSELG